MPGVRTTRRCRTLWPLPGGVGHQLDTLRAILGVTAHESVTDVVAAELVATYHLSGPKVARSYLYLIGSLGFIDVLGTHTFLTDLGQSELDVSSVDRVLSALLTRVDGCRELVELLQTGRPRRLGELAEEMRQMGYPWVTDSQVRYRLRWLEETGAVVRGPGGRPWYTAATQLP